MAKSDVMFSISSSLVLSISAWGENVQPFKVQLDRRNAQRLAIVLREFSGAPADMLERAVRSDMHTHSRAIFGDLVVNRPQKIQPVTLQKRGVVRIK